MDRGKALSPSELRTWSNCERLWWYERILGLRGPTSEAAQFGLDVEALIVGYLQGKSLPIETKAGRVALTGLEHLPPPLAHAYEFQRHAQFVFGGIAYHGYQDLVYETADAVHLIDTKTTGDFAWALTAQELRDDVQRIVYAHDLAQLSGKLVKAKWLYMERATKPRPARPITCDQTPKEAYASMMGVHFRLGIPIKQAYEQHANGAHGDVRARNLEHCGAYGGCPHATDCLANVSSGEKLRSAMMAARAREVRAEQKRQLEQQEQTTMADPVTEQTAIADRLAARRNALLAEQSADPGAPRRLAGAPAQAPAESARIPAGVQIARTPDEAATIAAGASAPASVNAPTTAPASATAPDDDWSNEFHNPGPANGTVDEAPRTRGPGRSRKEQAAPIAARSTATDIRGEAEAIVAIANALGPVAPSRRDAVLRAVRAWLTE